MDSTLRANVSFVFILLNLSISCNFYKWTADGAHDLNPLNHKKTVVMLTLLLRGRYVFGSGFFCYSSQAFVNTLLYPQPYCDLCSLITFAHFHVQTNTVAYPLRV